MIACMHTVTQYDCAIYDGDGGSERTGIVFDIREFTVHDGPGIRTTVFMKGCPLRCAWCHNPEGLAGTPQVMKSAVGERVVGRKYSASELAAIINGQAQVLRSNEGGVTFSGGEPLAQAAFVADVIDRLDGVHVVLDTSGYASQHDFRIVAGRSDLVFFDLKIIDPKAHRRYTGRDIAPILRNLRLLAELGRPFHIRVPLVPGVTDTEENLAAIAEAVAGMPGLVRVDLLAYNKAAGGKYLACGMEFKPDYDETGNPNANIVPFRERGMEVVIT